MVQARRDLLVTVLSNTASLFLEWTEQVETENEENVERYRESG